MTDTIPDVLSPRDESRLELSSRARTVAERAAALVPIAVDPEPGDLITQAVQLRALAEELLGAAVVAEREQGLSTDQIREFAGTQNWRGIVLAWVQDGRRNRSGTSGPVLAESLDEWTARDTPGASRPVTDGLDAVRFPGTAQYEAHHRDRVAGLHAALAEAIRERGEAWEDLNALTDEDAGVDHPVNVRVVNACRAMASAYRELALAEPGFAPEYQGEATMFTEAADRFAEHGPFA
ncbi:hypothetical protein [Streptomyces venezuelae]|uniref:hypothetical protein n=1 Tax=Streptomyces venezuelae TaxID=54571 RepID=UPI0009030406|nr:hypothetical protein [Streptomyces venezuelae]APE26750.1 hypothetical protein vnz_37170 [Streptomyces venezuelae]